MVVETIREKGGVTVLKVEGEVDLKTSSELRAAVQKAFQERPSAFYFDIGGVPYMDSSGVATLVEAYGLAGRNKIPFGLINPSDRVADILHLAHLNDIFPIHPDFEAARAAASETATSG